MSLLTTGVRMSLLKTRVIRAVAHTAARAEADSVGAQVPRDFASLDETLGHLAGAHVQRHLPPDLQGELYAWHACIGTDCPFASLVGRIV